MTLGNTLESQKVLKNIKKMLLKKLPSEVKEFNGS